MPQYITIYVFTWRPVPIVTPLVYVNCLWYRILLYLEYDTIKMIVECSLSAIPTTTKTLRRCVVNREVLYYKNQAHREYTHPHYQLQNWEIPNRLSTDH